LADSLLSLQADWLIVEEVFSRPSPTVIMKGRVPASVSVCPLNISVTGVLTTRIFTKHSMFVN